MSNYRYALLMSWVIGINPTKIDHEIKKLKQYMDSTDLMPEERDNATTLHRLMRQRRITIKQSDKD